MRISSVAWESGLFSLEDTACRVFLGKPCAGVRHELACALDGLGIVKSKEFKGCILFPLGLTELSAVGMVLGCGGGVVSSSDDS